MSFLLLPIQRAVNKQKATEKTKSIKSHWVCATILSIVPNPKNIATPKVSVVILYFFILQTPYNTA